MKRHLLLMVAALLCLRPGIVGAEPNGPALAPLGETPAQREARMAWWKEARFGLFIHWGIFSQAAGYWNDQATPGTSEWMVHDLQIPLSQYAKLVPEFNPEKFNADEWVRLAKSAGMKYIVITTKHHDGFAMWPSKLTDWCIKSTPFQRDPLKELAAACNKEGIKLCFYYSIMDWHSPLYAPRLSWNDTTTNPPDFDGYVTYMKGQLKELLTNYGPVGTLWFDGCWEPTWTRERGMDLSAYLRALQPSLLINNRVGFTTAWQDWFKDPAQVGGDFGTPEQTIPAGEFSANLDWEACMTMNGAWGYKKDDHNWKSAQTLVRNLIDCASKGGNYLLNVGPTAEGTIPGPSVERLQVIGHWMQMNGPAIYGTSASPFPRPLPWGRCTIKAKGKTTTLYLHVFDWPADGELLVPGLKNKVKSATLLEGRKKLLAQSAEDGATILLPATAPSTISSTVVLKVEGTPEIAATSVIQPARSGSFQLPASEAVLHGSTFRYESGGGLDDIGYWTNPQDWVEWPLNIRRTGKYEVSATVATPAGSSFEVSMNQTALPASVPATASYLDFKTVKLGVIELASTGFINLSVHPATKTWQPLNLKAIRLAPVEPQ